MRIMIMYAPELVDAVIPDFKAAQFEVRGNDRIHLLYTASAEEAIERCIIALENYEMATIHAYRDSDIIDEETAKQMPLDGLRNNYRLILLTNGAYTSVEKFVWTHFICRRRTHNV